jgi:hypothetical protein
VLGLSRLVFEFAGQLEGVVGRLLLAVLLLLRSHSREVIKAVLGFLKVRSCCCCCCCCCCSFVNHMRLLVARLPTHCVMYMRQVTAGSWWHL